MKEGEIVLSTINGKQRVQIVVNGILRDVSASEISKLVDKEVTPPKSVETSMDNLLGSILKVPKEKK